MSIGALAASIIRTVVPILLGGLLGWLSTLGIEFDAETSAALTNAVIIGVTAAVTMIYYVVVRLIEQKFPQIGILLGLKKAPAVYTNSQVAGVAIETVDGRTTTTGSLVPQPDSEGPGAADDPFNMYSRATYDAARHRAERK